MYPYKYGRCILKKGTNLERQSRADDANTAYREQDGAEISKTVETDHQEEMKENNLMKELWNTYPRPQMTRKEWLCLNGTWQLEADGISGSIQVPFCPESELSGWKGNVDYGKEMTYRRFFTLPESWSGRRTLLHFGAVNRKALVMVNGKKAAVHETGYLPFTADITEFLQSGKNELTVTVINDLSVQYPWGKQKKDRGGMWYTPVTGIWQTVWLEPVPEQYIRNLQIRTGKDYVDITVQGGTDGTVFFDGKEYSLHHGKIHIAVEKPRLWSPEDPYLYRFTVRTPEDCAESYFALRTLTVQKTGSILRLCLNDRPYFFHGLLDQGYWESGLYTPPSPSCYEQDILAMKALGFNTLRKHIKIEPEQFYYDCDRLGMIVFQDMVNNGDYRYLRDTALPTIGFTKRKDIRMHRDPETRRSFLESMDETVQLLNNHPSICLWTIFNEGWGQFCADEAYDRLKKLDDTRFIDSTSGWFHQKKTDVESLHIYFRKLALGKKNLPQLLSEFGGWNLRIPDHCFDREKAYGYKKYQDRETFVHDLRQLYLDQILPLIRQGLCGSIYTQVSDVEDETNGLVTYDREVYKISPEEFRDVSEKITSALTE